MYLHTTLLMLYPTTLLMTRGGAVCTYAYVVPNECVLTSKMPALMLSSHFSTTTALRRLLLQGVALPATHRRHDGGQERAGAREARTQQQGRHPQGQHTHIRKYVRERIAHHQKSETDLRFSSSATQSSPHRHSIIAGPLLARYTTVMALAG